MSVDANDPLSPLENLPVETIALLCDLLRDLADAIENRHGARLINDHHRRNERRANTDGKRGEYHPERFDDDRSPF